jgi:3-dehydroquinate synthetase
LVEVIKMGALRNQELFEILENSSIETLTSDNQLLSQVMKMSVRGKVDIVESDL